MPDERTVNGPEDAAGGRPRSGADDELHSCMLGLRTWLRSQVQAEVAGQLAVQVKPDLDLQKSFAEHVEQQARARASLDDSLAQYNARLAAAEAALASEVKPTLETIQKDGVTQRELEEKVITQVDLRMRNTADHIEAKVKAAGAKAQEAADLTLSLASPRPSGSSPRS